MAKKIKIPETKKVDKKPGFVPEDAPPGLFINAQYLKDLSFENPNPLDAYKDQDKPDIQVNVNTSVKSLPDKAFEVTLDIKTEAKKRDKVAFIAEVSYAGIFTLNKVPAEHEKPLLLIEAPRMLFPFARNVLAETTRDGGYPPLMLNPIDFNALYQQQILKEQKEKENKQQ
tara:strand:+ start:378 stop:890 length:513 start_codon:yes stop_codon:yes gene_type:complete